jgi:hypothetical protein
MLQERRRQTLDVSPARNFLAACGVQSNVRTNLAKSFVAVVSGNAFYFLILMPLLPPAARHRPYRLDLGLIVDFWVCLACYGIVELISRRTRSERRG